MHEKEQQAALTLTDPAAFAQSWLSSDLWEIQRQILNSVATRSKTAVKACHSSGKTFIAAIAVLWWLSRWKHCAVVTTAPTANQVEKLLWGDIHKALGRSRYPFPKANLTELKLAPDRYAVGFSTRVDNQGDEGVRFQGFHEEHVLIVLDEAPGVNAKIWEAIEGIRAGGDVRLLALGNPTISSGPFYDAFTASRTAWNTFTISAFDTPNLAGLKVDASGVPVGLLELSEEQLDNNPRPYLTTRRWVLEKYREWGPEHPLYESRVLGNFASQAPDALINLRWCESARTRALPAGGKLYAGLDVAGPGEDETVLVIRRGPTIVRLVSWPSEDPRGEIVAELNRFPRGEIEAVNVDSAGIGYYLGLHLKDLDFPVNLVNVATAPDDKEQFSNLKAELYWGLRQRLQDGDMCGLTDEPTIGQLVGIRYKHNSRGQVVIESKEEARKRGVKSPDRAEAVMLAFGKIQATGFENAMGYFDLILGASTAGSAAPGLTQAQLAERARDQQIEELKAILGQRGA